MPKFSIVVPVYNVEDYLYRCVDSILAQTFTDFEIILVDDGSPDDCPCICDEYAQKDSRVQVIHKENGGASSARNAGIDCAEGAYLLFCDSDDWWDSTLLEQVEAAIKQEPVDCVVFNYRRIESDGTICATQFESGIWRFGTLEKRMHYIYEYVFCYQHGMEIWTRAFRTDLIKNNQIYFCESCGNFAEDVGFVCKYMLFAENVSCINGGHYNYCIRKGSIMDVSEGQAKLHELNEVSFDVCMMFQSIYKQERHKKYIPFLHYILMNNQYKKLERRGQLEELPMELEKVKNREWFERQTASFKQHLLSYRKLCGLKNTLKAYVVSRFCLHKDFVKYCREKKVLNKVFGGS